MTYLNAVERINMKLSPQHDGSMFTEAIQVLFSTKLTKLKWQLSIFVQCYSNDYVLNVNQNSMCVF